MRRRERQEPPAERRHSARSPAHGPRSSRSRTDAESPAAGSRSRPGGPRPTPPAAPTAMDRGPFARSRRAAGVTRTRPLAIISSIQRAQLDDGRREVIRGHAEGQRRPHPPPRGRPAPAPGSTRARSVRRRAGRCRPGWRGPTGAPRGPGPSTPPLRVRGARGPRHGSRSGAGRSRSPVIVSRRPRRSCCSAF